MLLLLRVNISKSSNTREIYYQSNCQSEYYICLRFDSVILERCTKSQLARRNRVPITPNNAKVLINPVARIRNSGSCAKFGKSREIFMIKRRPGTIVFNENYQMTLL